MSATERRGPISAEFTGPGPLAYGLRPLIGETDHCTTKEKAPGYSLRPRIKQPANDVPGAPQYTIDAQQTRTGRQQKPAYSIQSRPAVKGIEVLPGPGAYNAHDTKAGFLSKENYVPSITMSAHTRSGFRHEAPPPNSYTLPDTLGQLGVAKKGAPHWSLRGRTNHGNFQYQQAKKGTPGPAGYGATDAGVYRVKSSSYSMQPRTRFRTYNSAKENPGPGAYNPEKPRTIRGGSYMGIRHSTYTLPLISDADIY